MRWMILFLLGFLLLSLSACGGPAAINSLDSGNQPIFIPPTLAPTSPPPLATDGKIPGAIAATSTPLNQCTDGLTYLEDLSIPDGSPTAANETLDKRWGVRNSGTCNWGEGYTIRLISGPEMGAEPQQALIPARAGTDAEIRILFTAPAVEGTQISAWQAFNPDGLPFGDPFFINIVVNP